MELTGHLGEDDCLQLIAAVDDRNKLRHIYDPEEIKAIVARLSDYASLMQRAMRTLVP